jgi:competence protein ComEC
MLTVVIIGWVLRRPSDLVNSLFAAALIILLWEPRQLFQAGFQLSFFVVLCIILTLPGLRELGRRLSAPDPLLPDELRPRWQQTCLSQQQTCTPAAPGLLAWADQSLQCGFRWLITAAGA